jgi:hypothetical protein
MDEMVIAFFVVFPAKAGIQGLQDRRSPWVAAFAMTTIS